MVVMIFTSLVKTTPTSLSPIDDRRSGLVLIRLKSEDSNTHMHITLRRAYVTKIEATIFT